MDKHELPTPALVVDLDAFEANLAAMADIARRGGKALRPHAKAHKCVEIARRQMAAGAVGVCAATAAEVELMAGAGIPVLFTSPAGEPEKARRVAACGAMVVVDHPRQVEWYDSAGTPLDALADLDCGDHRTGAVPGEQSAAVIDALRRSRHLRFRGVQAYSVRASHEVDAAGRERVSREAFASIESVLKTPGSEIVSGGSTGTAEIDARIPSITELQAGSYALMDMAYAKMRLPFRNAMTVLATVVSANHGAFVTVDAGYKALATDRGYPPDVVGFDGAAYRWGGDEFGFVSGARLALGAKVELLPPHCDPNVNLFDRIHACRRGRVEAVWEVMGRRR